MISIAKVLISGDGVNGYTIHTNAPVNGNLSRPPRTIYFPSHKNSEQGCCGYCISGHVTLNTGGLRSWQRIVK